MKAAARKVDLRAQLKHLYSPPTNKVEEVDVPEMTFVMIDGRGDPNRPSFSEAINVLYNLSYTLKFMVKKQQAIDYPVMPLEGLWWEGSATFDMSNRGDWKWTAMIAQPKFVTAQLYRQAVDEVRRKKGDGLPRLADARFEGFHEGTAVQTMHLGTYSAEAPDIQMLRDYIKQKGYTPRGRHHEIYLGDPRRTAPSRLRTVLRQPFTRP